MPTRMHQPRAARPVATRLLLALSDRLFKAPPVHMRRHLLTLVALFAVLGCDRLQLEGEEVSPSVQAPPPSDPVPDPEPAPLAPSDTVDARPPPLAEPVPLYEDGVTDHDVDAASARGDGYLLLDLSETWTPYLFTEQSNAEEERIEHAYRATYLALARGEFPDDHHGSRARRDKYLELYGIMPTLGLLRERFRRVRDLECREGLDLSALDSFDGFIRYTNNRAVRRAAARFQIVERAVARYVTEQGVSSEADLDEGRLDDSEGRTLREYRQSAARVAAVRATQARLGCEGDFEGKGDHVDGGLDWATHEAIAEFERRHRVYGWGFIGRETLTALRRSPMELEQEAVIRVLTERAVHSLGVLEDGSAEDSTYRNAAGEEVPVRDLEAETRERVIAGLGLTSPEAALDFLEGLGELALGEDHVVAIQAPTLPEYYSGNMDIRIEIDRGDVWYEFPYDNEGHERGQSVQRRPHLTVVVRHRGQRIEVARFGTTIGGWRSEEHDGDLWWRYKNSPVGQRVWQSIVSAPVWMPPASTPARSLLHRVPRRSGRDAYRVNYHETGPSYASAYGLVAAYHRMYSESEGGEVRIRGDEGIRTHGSVDYMSIMRRHSHGCHRLHNHIAVRLMSWVLAHRPHRRVGHRETAFHRLIQHEGYTYELDIERGGYVFQLEQPIRVVVLEGRIRGSRGTPIDELLPRFDSEIGAFVNPAGEAFTISRTGEMSPFAYDAGVLDGGLPDGGIGGIPPSDIADPFAPGQTTNTPAPSPSTASPSTASPSTD